MGCCEPNKVLKFNNHNEIQTRIKHNNNNDLYFSNSNNNNINDDICQLKMNANNYFNSKKEYDSEQSQQREFVTEIPQTKSVDVPATKIPIEIIQTKKQLQLTIYESKFLPEGRTLIINPGGLVGSERNAQDGVTKFGINNVSIINNISIV